MKGAAVRHPGSQLFATFVQPRRSVLAIAAESAAHIDPSAPAFVESYQPAIVFVAESAVPVALSVASHVEQHRVVGPFGGSHQCAAAALAGRAVLGGPSAPHFAKPRLFAAVVAEYAAFVDPPAVSVVKSLGSLVALGAVVVDPPAAYSVDLHLTVASSDAPVAPVGAPPLEEPS